MSIRFKVIIPYLLLTLVVAAIGIYVVTQLVSKTQEERFKNQLRQAGQIVSSEFNKQDMQHVNKARLIAFTVGLPESLQAGDHTALEALVRPQIAADTIEQVFLLDEQGREQLHLDRVDNRLESIDNDSNLGNSAWIRSLFLEKEETSTRMLGRYPGDGRYYHYTALTILNNEKVVGVVVVGTSLDAFLMRLKNIALVDIILYNQITAGKVSQIIASTLPGQIESETPGDTFQLDQVAQDEILANTNIVYGEYKTVSGREYGIARGLLRIRNDQYGIFGVVLPLDYVIETSATNRNFYMLLFTAVFLVVVLLGYGISRLIINPLHALLRASQAIAGGDLSQRTGIKVNDELGELSHTFDGMTENLEARTNELERTYKVLEQMDRAKASFIEVAAHELRTPLTLVKGYTQMLTMKFKDEPETLALTEGIMDGSNRMQEIVSSMLDVSRIDSNVLKIVPEDTNLGVILARIHKNLEAALQERNLTYALQGVDELPNIQADPDLLHKVFYNLIINAIKYTPDGGHITVSGRQTEIEQGPSEIEIVVSDTGIGINPEHHELIFEKFYQTGEIYTHSSGKTKFKGGGPGLGLAIARGIIKAHGGRVWVESPGYDEAHLPGSKFFVRLPVKAEDYEHNLSTEI